MNAPTTSSAPTPSAHGTHPQPHVITAMIEHGITPATITMAQPHTKKALPKSLYNLLSPQFLRPGKPTLAAEHVERDIGWLI